MAIALRLAALSDGELAALASAGDRSAFGELVRRHGSLVRGLLRRMGAQPALADDLAQDAFLAAFSSIANYRGEGAFGGWICRIAARLYVKRWRKEQRYHLFAEIPEDAGQEVSPVSPGDRMDLDAGLASLSPAERICVSLCFGAGLSHSEAADVLRAPLGTVKSHVKRGLDKLKARLASDEGTKSGNV